MSEEIVTKHSESVTPVSREVNQDQMTLAASLFKRRLWSTLRRALREKGVSQSDLAQVLNVNRSTVSRMLAGPTNITTEKAGQIARAAGYYIEVSLSPVESSSAEMQLRAFTQDAYGCIRSTQPHNRWSLTFQRHPETSGWSSNAVSGDVPRALQQPAPPVSSNLLACWRPQQEKDYA